MSGDIQYKMIRSRLLEHLFNFSLDCERIFVYNVFKNKCLERVSVMKKTLKVKSRFRFTAFVLVMLFAVTGLFNTALGLNNAAGLTKQEYIEVSINSGDTLWTIAEQYMPPDMDKRKAVHILKSVNDIDSQLQPGQTILIPEYA